MQNSLIYFQPKVDFLVNLWFNSLHAPGHQAIYKDQPTLEGKMIISTTGQLAYQQKERTIEDVRHCAGEVPVRVVTYLHKFPINVLSAPVEMSMTGGWLTEGIRDMPWQHEVGSLDAPEYLACGSYHIIGEGHFCYPMPTISRRG